MSTNPHKELAGCRWRKSGGKFRGGSKLSTYVAECVKMLVFPGFTHHQTSNFPTTKWANFFSMKHQIIEHKMKTFPCLAYTHKTWLFQKGERVHVGGRPQKSVSSLSLIEFSYLFVYRWIRADVEERRERLHCHWRAPSRRQPQVNHFSSSHTHEFLMMDLSKL